MRNGKSPDEVPGCVGKANGGDDYCISPADLPPTPRPTEEPTLTPTRRPTLAPTESPVAITNMPTKAPVLQTQPTVKSTPPPTDRPTPMPVPVAEEEEEDGSDGDADEAWLDLTPGGGGGQGEQFDSADTTQWVYLSPFELSLDFQTINNRSRRHNSRTLRATTILTAYPTLRRLQQLSTLIDTANLEDVLDDIIGNKMGALSTGYNELDLDIALKDEQSYEDGRITVTYDVEGNVGFDTVDGEVPTEERVRQATQRAVHLNPFGEDSGLLDPTKPAPNGDGGKNNLVEILVLVIIVVVCIGATTIAVLYVRKRRKDKAFKRNVEINRSKMDQDRNGGGQQSGRGRGSSAPAKKPSATTPPAKSFQGQRPPAQSTPPTPALTPPPVGTISVKKSRSLPQSRSASAKKQLFVKDTPAKSKLRKKTKRNKITESDASMPDPPESDVEGGDWSVSVRDTGLDRARSMPLNSGLASLTSMENIDTDLDDANDTLGDANEDNTVSSLGGESLTFGGTAAGESIFGKDGIKLDAVLRLDEERSQSSMSELGEGSFGNRPRYRDRAAAQSKKKSKPANKKTRGAPPQPSAAAQDLEGQVKAFEERVLGLSAQEEHNLPSRLRSN